MRNIFHVSAKGRKTHIKRLTISNISKNIPKNRKPCSFFCRNRNTSLIEHSKKCKCFKRNRFSPCIRTSNNKNTFTRHKSYIYRYSSVSKQRMTGSQQKRRLNFITIIIAGKSVNAFIF